MTSLRLWIAVLALTTFCTGIASGFLLSFVLRPDPEAQPQGLEHYRESFVTTFDLEPARARLFEKLLRNYEAELEDVRQRALANSLADMEPELGRMAQRYRDLVRNHVLPQESRARFDALARSTAVWSPAL